MKNLSLKTVVPSLGLLLVIIVFSWNSIYVQQEKPGNRHFTEISPTINGRTPALDFLIDDPQSVDEMVRKLNLYDDTGFSHLRDLHPTFDR